MNGADYILKTLSASDIKCFFTVPGAHLDPLLEATDFSDLKPIVCCHELAAGFMADGYSRVNKTMGVVAAIGGPGAGNLVTAVHTARIENIPMLIITGDVPSSMSCRPAFQSAGDFGSGDDRLFAAITKYSRRVTSVQDLPGLLAFAVAEALSPPRGPVHLIIPYDVFKETLSEETGILPVCILPPAVSGDASRSIASLCEIISGDSKTVLWLGDAVNTGELSQSVLAIAEKFHLPVATTFSAKGVIPETHPLSLGNFGYAGSSRANFVMLSEKVETIIGFDIEQNERNTLNWHPGLYEGKKVILANYSRKFAPADHIEFLCGDPAGVLVRLHHALEKIPYNVNGRAEWYRRVTKSVPEDVVPPSRHHGKIEMAVLMKILRRQLPVETLFFVDSGMHRIFAGTDWQALRPETFFSAAATAPTGWAIAAGTGGKIGCRDPVVILTGDGCMQMHGLEMKTAVRYGIPVIVVLCNNHGMGNIHRRLARVSVEAAEHTSINEVDWTAFARSLGVRAFDAEDEKSLVNSLQLCLREPQASLINVRVPIDSRIRHEAHCRSAFA